MMNLIKNEFIKLGFKKQFISFIVLTIIIIINYFINNEKLSVDNMFTLIPFIGIIISILFSGIISEEIDSGTFRFYLTKPVSRTKIYISKLLTIIIFTFELLISTLLIHIILKVDVKNVNNFFITSISLVFISTIIMLLSTFIKNRSITSGINILLLTFGITITELLLSKDINIVKYTFLPYIDLSYYKNNLIDTINQLYDVNLSLKLGIPILIFYSILFTLIGIRIFKKKNI